VYSGKHFGARVAAARHAGPLGGSKQLKSHANTNTDANSDPESNSNTHTESYSQTESDSYAYTNPDSYAHSDSNSYADANSYADSDTNSDTHADPFRRKLRGCVEFHHCLSWWKCRECRQQQLHGAVLESGIESDHGGQQRPRRYRRSLVLTGSMQRSIAYAHSNTYTDTDTHSNTNANTQANSDTHSYAYSNSYTDSEPYSHAKPHSEHWIAEPSPDGLLAGLQQWRRVFDHRAGAHNVQHHRRGLCQLY
jgi:hypothetical protein